jgi:hypothetical protein
MRNLDTGEKTLINDKAWHRLIRNLRREHTDEKPGECNYHHKVKHVLMRNLGMDHITQ